jgi:hypothetical protein
MTAFIDRHDPDDVACRELTSKITLLGTLCLIVMHQLFPQQISGERLAYRFKVSDKRKTLDPVLADLWTYGYASHTGTDHWRITDIGRQALTSLIASTAASPALLLTSASPAQPLTTTIVDNSPTSVEKSAGENLRPDLSSNRSMIDHQSIDRSSIIEEEQQQKISWLDSHQVTGDKRRAALASPLCTAALLDAWLQHWTLEGKTAKGEPFRSKWGPLNYALTCAINGDIPPAPSPVGEGWGEGNDDPENISEPEKVEPPSNPLPTFDGVPIFQNPIKIWQAAQGELQLQMTRATFDTWVKNTCGIDYTNDTITVAVQNENAREWWDTRVKTTAQRIVTGIIGQHTDVRFTVWRSA